MKRVSNARAPEPPHAIGAAAEKLGLHPRTLMAYERIGLVKPARRSTRRRYSDDEIRWLGCVQAFNRKGGISLQGLTTLLRFVPCWAIRREIDAGNDICCPPAYPAADCLGRVHGAYAGSAPAGCQSCGVYRANAETCDSALEGRIQKGRA